MNELITWLDAERERLAEASRAGDPLHDDQMRALTRKNQAQTSMALATAIAHISACYPQAKALP